MRLPLRSKSTLRIGAFVLAASFVSAMCVAGASANAPVAITAPPLILKAVGPVTFTANPLVLHGIAPLALTTKPLQLSAYRAVPISLTTRPLSLSASKK